MAIPSRCTFKWERGVRGKGQRWESGQEGVGAGLGQVMNLRLTSFLRQGPCLVSLPACLGRERCITERPTGRMTPSLSLTP